MRQARAGDVLTHAQLTGEDSATSSPPPSGAASPSTASNKLPSLGSQEATMPMTAASAASAGVSAVPEMEQLVAVTAPRPAATAVRAPPPAPDGGLVIDLGAPMGTPTSIYDSPEWPGELDRAAAAAEPLEPLEIEPVDDVQQQIEAELQRQLEAKAAAQSAAEQAQRATTAPVPRPETVRPEPVRAPPTAPKTTSTTVVTTVGPPPKRPVPSQEAEPSIVIAMDLEPGEPTVVGAAAPVPRSDVNRTVEVSPVGDRARSGGGFNQGGVHESLIIDFDGEAEAQVAAPEDKSIRPAAKPLGKSVVPAVAQPKRATSPRAATVAPDESLGNTMPPPTRRR
jgi:hypothetical protein